MIYSSTVGDHEGIPAAVRFDSTHLLLEGGFGRHFGQRLCLADNSFGQFSTEIGESRDAWRAVTRMSTIDIGTETHQLDLCISLSANCLIR